MSKPIQKFIERLQSVLGPHDKAKPEALLKELHMHLGKFTEDELQEAATLLFASQKTKFWPTFGAMVIAAQEARRKLRKYDSPHAPLGRPRRRNSIGEWYTPRSASEEEAYWSREAFEAADKLVQSELGREAADEGWIGDLYDFAREHRRLPKVNEQYSLKKKSKLTDKLFATTQPGKANHRMMEGALNRRDALARVAYGKASGWRWQEQNEGSISKVAERVNPHHAD